LADIRTKAVFNTLAPLYEEANYGIDLAATQMREPLGLSDQIGIPSISSMTVNASGAVDATPEAVTNSELTLNANLEPWINAKLPQIDSFALNGTWAAQTAAQVTQQLKNKMDEDFLQYLIARNHSTAATAAYHVNVAGDSLTSSDLLEAIATLTSNRGVDVSDLAFMMSPWGRASLSNISGFVPNTTDSGGQVNGLPAVGTLYNIPVYQSSSVPNGRTIASTAFADDGTDMVITLGADHGLVVGMKITFDTVTAANDISAATAITACTSTTITVASVNTASATEAGTVTAECSESLLISKANTFVAQQMIPKIRTVDLYNSTGSALQVSAVWGRVARAGRAIVICSPKSAL